MPKSIELPDWVFKVAEIVRIDIPPNNLTTEQMLQRLVAVRLAESLTTYVDDEYGGAPELIANDAQAKAAYEAFKESGHFPFDATPMGLTREDWDCCPAHASGSSH